MKSPPPINKFLSTNQVVARNRLLSPFILKPGKSPAGIREMVYLLLDGRRQNVNWSVRVFE